MMLCLGDKRVRCVWVSDRRLQMPFLGVMILRRWEEPGSDELCRFYRDLQPCRSRTARR